MKTLLFGLLLAAVPVVSATDQFIDMRPRVDRQHENGRARSRESDFSIGPLGIESGSMNGVRFLVSRVDQQAIGRLVGMQIPESQPNLQVIITPAAGLVVDSFSVIAVYEDNGKRGSVTADAQFGPSHPSTIAMLPVPTMGVRLISLSITAKKRVVDIWIE